MKVLTTNTGSDNHTPKNNADNLYLFAMLFMAVMLFVIAYYDQIVSKVL